MKSEKIMIIDREYALVDAQQDLTLTCETMKEK